MVKQAVKADLENVLYMLINTTLEHRTCKKLIYQDEIWEARVIRPYADQDIHLYAVRFQYRNGCAGTKTIKFVNGDAQITHSGGGKNIKIKTDVKNTILELERMYRYHEVNNFETFER